MQRQSSGICYNMCYFEQAKKGLRTMSLGYDWSIPQEVDKRIETYMKAKAFKSA